MKRRREFGGVPRERVKSSTSIATMVENANPLLFELKGGGLGADSESVTKGRARFRLDCRSRHGWIVYSTDIGVA